MRKLFSLMSGAILLSPAAYGQPPSIYLETPQCLSNGFYNYGDPLQLPGSQLTPIAIRAFVPDGATTFEFSIPGFTEEAGILVTDVVSNSEAIFAEGNPFAEGARIYFATCQSGFVTLFTANLFVLGSGATVPWTVALHSSPRTGSTCPTTFPCGAGSACLNAGPPRAFQVPPNTPSPADGATNVPLNARLGFSLGVTGFCTPCLGVSCLTLFFGVDPDPPAFFGLCDMEWPDLDLEPSTTYYWRVREDWCGNVIGPVWSFTTAPPIGVEAVPWSNVKRLFR